MVLIREEQNALVAHNVPRKDTDEKRVCSHQKGLSYLAGMVLHTCNSRIWEAEAKRLQVECQPG